jgi:hypothetical protein
MRRIIEWCLLSADGIVLDDPLLPGFRGLPGRRLSPGCAGLVRGVRRNALGPDHISAICGEILQNGADPSICRASQCDPEIRFFVEAGNSRVAKFDYRSW